MDSDFLEFADQVLMALADEKSSAPDSEPDLQELCERLCIVFTPRWLPEVPKFLEARGDGADISTSRVPRFRIEGAGLARAANLRTDSTSEAMLLSAVELGAPLGRTPANAAMPPHTTDARFAYIFDQATLLLPLALKALYAEHSAKGRLRAGVTVIRAARIAADLSKDAVEQGLEAVSLATATPGRRRDKLLNDLAQRLEAWMADATDLIAGQIHRFGLARKLLEPLMEENRRGRIGEIDQYRGGWTSPRPTHWKDRNPTWHAIILLAVGGLIGLLLGSIALPKWDVGELFGITGDISTNH